MSGLPGWTAPVTTGKAGFGGAFEAATAVAVGHGIVAVGGKTGSISGATSFLARTFDAATGNPGCPTSWPAGPGRTPSTGWSSPRAVWWPPA